MFPSADLYILEILMRIAIDSNLIVALRTLFPNSWAGWLLVKSSYIRGLPGELNGRSPILLLR